MAEIKSINAGIKGIQYLHHLMKQPGILRDIDCPTLLLNNNQGSIDKSGCCPTKKLQHKNLLKLSIAEACKHCEVKIY